MSIPAEFKDLEKFVDQWALAAEADRSAARQTSSMESLTEFYNAMQARLESVLAALADYSPDSLSDDLKPLFYLTLSYCEVAPAVELFKQPSVVDGFDPKRLPRVDIPNMTPPEI